MSEEVEKNTYKGLEMKNEVKFEAGNLNAGLFLFFLVLTSNFTMDRVLPNSLIRFLEKSRAAEHIIAFFILLFTVNVYATKNKPFYVVLGYVILLWLWFIVTTKMHLLPVCIILFLLLISFICHSVKDTIQHKNITPEREERIKYFLNKIQNIIFYSVIVITVIGGSIYFREKYNKYGGESDNLISFIFKFYFLATGNKSTNV